MESIKISKFLFSRLNSTYIFLKWCIDFNKTNFRAFFEIWSPNQVSMTTGTEFLIVNNVNFFQIQLLKPGSVFSVFFRHEMINTEAKKLYQTFWHVSWVNDPERHLKPSSVMWLTLLRILHKLSTKNLFEKVNLRQLPVTGSHTWQVYMAIMSLRLRHFAAQCFRNLNTQKRENEQVPAPHSLFQKKLICKSRFFSS